MDAQTEKPSPHSGNLRLHRRREGSGFWFVTKCVNPRVPVLNGAVATVIADALTFYACKGEVNISAFAVMPDHWHALLMTRQNQSISRFMGKLSRWVARRTVKEFKDAGCDWQEGFYETLVRSAKQFGFIREYIEANPVRKGLAESSGCWPWSSAHQRYAGGMTKTWHVWLD
jgi:putative transposase